LSREGRCLERDFQALVGRRAKNGALLSHFFGGCLPVPDAWRCGIWQACLQRLHRGALAGGRKMFELDPQLAADTLPMGDFPLCRLLLMNDAQYPWFILVPRREEVSEVFQLSGDDQRQLWKESVELA